MTVQDDVEPIPAENREEFSRVQYSVIPTAWLCKRRYEHRVVVNHRDLTAPCKSSDGISSSPFTRFSSC